MYVVQSLVYRLSTEERINKKKNKIPPTTRVKPSSIRGKTSLFPDEKHIWLTSRHIFSQEIAHLLWGCDVSGGFCIYLIVYFQLLQRWVEGLAVKAQTRTMILFSSFRHRSLPLPQACKCQDMENTCQVGKCYLFFSTCQSASQSVRRGPGTYIRHTYLTAGLTLPPNCHLWKFNGCLWLHSE